MNEIELVQSLIIRVNALQYNDLMELDAIYKHATMIIINIHGENSRYLKELHDIIFIPNQTFCEENMKKYWMSGQSKMRNTFNIMIEELELFGRLK